MAARGTSFGSPSLVVMTDDKMLARIAALLRQAEGTDNAHEAEAFMAAAQRLATATSIDLAVARSHADKRTPAQAPVQRTITIGAAGTKGLRTYVQLFVVIASANDVRCDIASNSTFVYAYGFAEDIDATHALYASLVVQMVRASDCLHLVGRASADPDDHRPAEFSAGVRRAGRSAVGRGPRADPARSQKGPPSSAWNGNRVAEQGVRASRLLPHRVEGARHLAGQPGRRGLFVGGPAGGGPGRQAGEAGQRPGALRGAERAGAVNADEFVRSGLAALEGLRRRGIRTDVVRPRRRTRFDAAWSSSARS